MKALHPFVLKVLLCTAVIFQPWSSAVEHDDVCRFFPNNTQIRDPLSCNQYIVCIDFISHYKQCTGSTPYYNKNTSKCVKTLEDLSNCITIEGYCENHIGQFISDPASCGGYYYCDEKDAPTYGKCSENLYFNATLQSCAYNYKTNCTTTQYEFCDIVKDGVNIRNPTNCATYFVCAKGKLTPKTCPQKYYDAATGKCVQKSQIDCPQHPYPKDVCGTDNKPRGNVFVADGATCSGYFFCSHKEVGSDHTPKWMQCPPDKFFNPKTQTCVNPLSVKCVEDRCNGRTLNFVSSGTQGCRNYLRCKVGRTVQELSCGNMFFDEKMGACVSGVVLYDSCK